MLEVIKHFAVFHDRNARQPTGWVQVLHLLHVHVHHVRMGAQARGGVNLCQNTKKGKKGSKKEER